MSATTAFMNLFNDVDPPSDVSDEDVEDSKVHEGEEDILPSSQVTTISNDKMRITFGLQTPNPVEVTLKIDSGQCGGTTWPAGRVLTEYLALRGSGSIGGKRLLELGSGTGLVGIAAAKLGAEEVFITDQRPLMSTMEANINLNDVSGRVKAEELNWGEPISIDRFPRIDVVLAADCVYFEPAYPLLIQTLCDLHALNPQAEFLFCYRQRRKADRKFFLSLLKKHFTWSHVDDDPNQEVYARKSLVLFRLERRQGR